MGYRCWLKQPKITYTLKYWALSGPTSQCYYSMITSHSQITAHCEIEEFIKVEKLHFLSKIPPAKQANSGFSNEFAEILLMYKHFSAEPVYSCSWSHTFHAYGISVSIYIYICLHKPPARALCKIYYYKLHCHPTVFSYLPQMSEKAKCQRYLPWIFFLFFLGVWCLVSFF